MSGRASRNKGNAFERLVAKRILSAVGDPYTSKDCYRTPLSGGHPMGDSGDLVISERLAKVFPFTVECKHYRDLRLEEFLRPKKAVSLRTRVWLQQAERCGVKQKRIPLLVFRTNHRYIYVAVYCRNKKASRWVGLRVPWDDPVVWDIVPFETFLDRVKEERSSGTATV